MKSKKAIRVYLRPEDFNGNEYSNGRYCPLKRAIDRKFGKNTMSVCPWNIWENKKVKFNIGLGGFEYNDFLYVREQYRKDPKMKKAQYYITLMPV